MGPQEIKMGAVIRAVRNHGGARPGAGRPEGTTKPDAATATVKLRVHPDEKAELQRRAKARGVSVTEYIILCTLTGS